MWKMQENREKNIKRKPNARKCFYITLCIGQKRESVAFSSRFACVLLAFCSQTLQYMKQNSAHLITQVTNETIYQFAKCTIIPQKIIANQID